MGKRGPAKTPTALALLRGGRADRINTNEPKPVDALPDPPHELAPDVREVWDYTIAVMEVMKTAKQPDRDSLVAYCEAVIVHRKASALLAQSSILVTGQKGTVVKNPAVQVQRDAAMTIKAFAAEFGLTPRARSEFRGTAKEHGNASRLLSGG